MIVHRSPGKVMKTVWLGQRVFDTTVTFQDGEGNLSYGAWGHPVKKYRGAGVSVVGLQADDPEYSWGEQLDGSYIEHKVHAK